MTERDIKFQAFVEDDNANNFGRIVNACNESLFLFEHPEVSDLFEKQYLTQCLAHAVTFSEFYKPYAKFKSLQDFPIVNKQVLRDHWDEIAVKEYADAPGTRTKHTSGSTGTPFTMVFDRVKNARTIADRKVIHEIVGVRSHDKMVFIMDTVRDRQIPKERMERDNVYYLECPSFDEVSLQNLLDYCVKNEVVTLVALASFYDGLAYYVNSGKAPKWAGHMIGCFSQSETLKPATKKVVEQYLQCPLYSYYANEENGPMAQEDGTEYGHRVNTGSYFFEVLKMDSDEPAEDGELGRLVITDYFNRAFPIIRYENGDLVAKKTLPDGRVYFTKIGGRQTDALYMKDGSIANVFNVMSFVEPFTDIKQFQIIQNDYQDFTWVLNTTNHSYEEFIIKESKALFGDDCKISFQYVDEIPKLQSGKRRMTICNIKDKK